MRVTAAHTPTCSPMVSSAFRYICFFLWRAGILRNRSRLSASFFLVSAPLDGAINMPIATPDKKAVTIFFMLLFLKYWIYTSKHRPIKTRTGGSNNQYLLQTWIIKVLHLQGRAAKEKTIKLSD